MSYVGIDYGMGTTNRDTKTGIRYGVISQYSVLQAWSDSSEPDYGDMTEEEIENCDETPGWKYEGDGYLLSDCLDSDIMVLRSPYYTFAQFCSPCCPGAGNLESPMEDGIKTYCLGHDWFELTIAPYPVYSVATGEKVTCPCITANQTAANRRPTSSRRAAPVLKRPRNTRLRS